MVCMILAVLWPLQTPLGAAETPASSPVLEDIDLLTLEVPVVVTGATRRAQKIEDLPYAVSVITAREIELAGARSVPDALRLVPGVDVAELAYGFYSVSPRGFYANQGSQSLILVDGREIFDSFLGGTFWGSWPFKLEDIERIEVIRGPAGVTWGANATNGLINIVTKDPADQLGLTFDSRAGSRGVNREYVGYGFQDGALRMRVSGEHEGSDGFREGGSLLRGLNDYYEAGRFSLYGVADLGIDDTLTFSAGSALVDGIYPTSLGHGFFGIQSPGSRANYAMARWDHRIEHDNAWSLTGYINEFHHNFGGNAYDVQYQQAALQLNHTFKPAENHTLVWGVDTLLDHADGSNADPYFLVQNHLWTGNIGIYIADDWRLAPQWTLSLGGQVDYECYGGFEPSARAALSYEPDEDSLIYGAVSRAYKMPAAGLRYINMQLLNGLMHMQADKDIANVHLLAYELGYRRRNIADCVDFNANVYWHEYNHTGAFSTQLGWPELILTNFSEAGASSTYGVELGSTWRLSEKLTAQANYTFQMLSWRADDAPDFSLAVESITPPKHKAMIGLNYKATEDLTLSSHAYYVDAVRTPNSDNPFGTLSASPYIRLDLRAEHEFWNDRASIAVGVSNLLDPGHYEGRSKFYAQAEVPRMVYAELRIHFD